MTARKMTEFAKIPQSTKPGQYAVDYGFTYLIDFVDEEIATAGLVMEPDFAADSPEETCISTIQDGTSRSNPANTQTMSASTACSV